jgi:hypothetical protein
MRTPLLLFKFVAKAALNHVGFGIAGDLAVEVLPSIARDVWGWWGKGKPAAELRDDVHAVGVIWLHLLTGDLALEPGYWRDALHGRDVPQPMLDVLQSCLALRAEQRLPSAVELRSRLAAVLTKPRPPTR